MSARVIASSLGLVAAMLVVAGSSSARALQPTRAPVVNLIFQPTAEVRSDVIRLGDIATVNCPDEAVQRRLYDFLVGHAPNPGSTQMMRVERIRQMVELYLRSGVETAGAAMVAVQRPAAPLKLEALGMSLRRWLAADWHVDPKDIRTLDVTVTGNVYLPQGEQRYEFEDSGRSPEIKGIISVGQFRKEVVLRFRCTVSAIVAVPVRDLPFGKIPTAGDIEFKKCELPRSPWNYVRYSDQLRLVSFKTIARSGQPIPLDSLRNESAVKNGTPVTISYHSETVSLATEGKAMQPGKIGQLIQVKNISSGRVIMARVIAEDLVMVENKW